MSTITPNPTLDPEWTPSAYGCRGKGDFWIWDFHADNDRRTVLGGPSQTTNCFPSTWNPASAYGGTKCPAGFTSACRSSGPAVPTTICCPTVYSFSCVDNASNNPHGPWFPCISQYGTSMKRTVTRTDFAMNTITFGEVTQNTNLHLFALGMAIASPTTTATSDPDATSPLSSSTSELSSTSQSSISAGAAAGIGVGSAAGVVLIALLAWYLLRRRRKSADTVAPPVAENPGGFNYGKVMQNSPPPQELHGEEARELPG